MKCGALTHATCTVYLLSTHNALLSVRAERVHGDLENENQK
jgi:hypothetical protein